MSLTSVSTALRVMVVVTAASWSGMTHVASGDELGNVSAIRTHITRSSAECEIPYRNASASSLITPSIRKRLAAAELTDDAIVRLLATTRTVVALSRTGDVIGIDSDTCSEIWRIHVPVTSQRIAMSYSAGKSSVLIAFSPVGLKSELTIWEVSESDGTHLSSTAVPRILQVATGVVYGEQDMTLWLSWRMPESGWAMDSSDFNELTLLSFIQPESVAANQLLVNHVRNEIPYISIGDMSTSRESGDVFGAGWTSDGNGYVCRVDARSRRIAREQLIEGVFLGRMALSHRTQLCAVAGSRAAHRFGIHHPDDSVVEPAYAKSDSCVYILGAGDLRLLRILAESHGAILSIQFDESGRLLCVCDSEGGVRIWDCIAWRPSPREELSGATCAAFVPERHALAIGTLSGSIAILEYGCK